MSFSRQEVEKIAHLARLKLSEPELDAMSAQLSAILEHIEEMKSIDTTGVEPLAHALPMQNCFRDDVRVPSLTQDEALRNSPKRVGDFFAVPAILE